MRAGGITTPTAHHFLGGCLKGPEVLIVAYHTLMSYLRIATHPSIFPDPLTHGEAWENVRTLAAQPHVRCVGETDGFLIPYAEITAAHPPCGNQVPDAHLAGLLRQHGVRLVYSTDRDFDRYPFLKAVNPFIQRADRV